MKNTTITLMRCVISLCMKEKLSLEEIWHCLGLFLIHSFESSSVTDWRFVQIVSILVEFGLKFPEFNLHKLLSVVFEKAKPFVPKMAATLPCDKCKMPKYQEENQSPLTIFSYRVAQDASKNIIFHNDDDTLNYPLPFGRWFRHFSSRQLP